MWLIFLILLCFFCVMWHFFIKNKLLKQTLSLRCRNKDVKKIVLTFLGVKKMKNIVRFSCLALVLGFCGEAFAQNGGYLGPSIAKSSVAEALKLRDDSAVVLEGKIEKSLGAEKYVFTDATGSVTVEIDNEDWNGVSVNENDIVVIKGEIDKDLMSVEIDVDSVAKK